jgi:anti-anti-sigma factor
MSGEFEGARRQIAGLVSEVRGFRAKGQLRAAVAALDKAVTLVTPTDKGAAWGVADEAVKLGLALEKNKAPLAALSEFVRALDLAPTNDQAREGIARGAANYTAWAPPCGSLGNQLSVGATGAFWVGRGAKGRVVVFNGGINGETVVAAKKALEVAANGVNWLVVDMKKLVYVGSTGLAAAVKVAETLESRGGGLILFAVASNLGVVIETLGLGRYLDLVSDLPKAFERVRERRQNPRAGRGSSESAQRATARDEGRDEPSGLEE